MLTETYLLAQALERAGVSTQSEHSSVRPPGLTSGPVLKVILNIRGEVTRLESIVKENLSGLWSHFDGKKNSFPVIRFKEPLLALPQNYTLLKQEKGKPKSSPDAYRERLIAACAVSIPAKINDIPDLYRLRSKAQFLAEISKSVHPQIERICRAYLASTPVDADTNKPVEPVVFIETLRTIAMQWITIAEPEELETLELLLFTPAPKNSSDQRKRTQFALEIENESTIYTKSTRLLVSKLFLSSESGNATQKTDDVEQFPIAYAYPGHGMRWNGPFPEVRIPTLGKGFSIFAKNKDAECNTRYGLKSSEAIAVSREAVLKMQDALNWIFTEDHKGQTWRSIVGEKPDSYDQLVVFVEDQSIPSEIADFFGNDSSVDTEQFENNAKVVCTALEGMKERNPDCRLNLFILRKASEGQAMIVLAETPTVSEVLDGAEWWQNAACNIPLGGSDKLHISQRFYNPETKRTSLRTPTALYPAQVVRLVTQAWGGKEKDKKTKKDKLREYKLRGAAFGEILDIMLQRPQKSQTAAQHILTLCLQHFIPLLKAMGEWQNLGSSRDLNLFPDKDRQAFLNIISVIGMTLSALNSPKENYMHEPAFAVGRMLALADRLHRCYCTVVRDGSMPPNLIGNALFDAALDNPENAFARLAERIRIYLGWATTASADQPSEKRRIAVLEAKKILRQYQPYAAELSEKGVPSQTDDKTKAHLLLGYLAANEAEDNSQTTEPESTDTNK